MIRRLRDDETTPTLDVMVIPEGHKQWWTAPSGAPDGEEVPLGATPVVRSIAPNEPPICQGEANPRPHAPAVTTPTDGGNFECPEPRCKAIWYP